MKLPTNTWTNAPKRSIRKTNVGIAKNYLNENELDGLNRIVSMIQYSSCVIITI
jgi:hypothetical protein